MAIFGLLACLIAIFILYKKLWFVCTGKVVAGEIIGHEYGARGVYGFRGYNYRIRFEYKNEIYIAKSLESTVTTSGSIPKRGLGEGCLVYFNPKSPKLVSVKGRNGVIWLAVFLLLCGLLIVLFSIF